MSDTAAAAVDTGVTATAVNPDLVTSEALTPAEQAYFSSRGEKMGGEPATDGTAVGKETLHTEQDAAPETVNPDEVVVGDDGKARDKAGKFVKQVPFGVFHSAKQQLKAKEAELAKRNEDWTRADERLRILLSEPEEKKAAAEPEKDIDPKEDIFGAYEQMARKMVALEKGVTEGRKTAEQRDADTRIQQTWSRDQASFKSQNPDYDDAVKTVLEAHAKRHIVLGNATTEPELRALLSSEIADFVKSSYARKGNPAEALYKLAKEVYGYKPKAAEGEAGKTAAGDAAKAALDEIANINKGKTAAATLNGAGAGAGLAESGASLITKLANMSDDEFHAFGVTYKAKNGADAWRKLIGG